jgi:hypothetical protein
MGKARGTSAEVGKGVVGTAVAGEASGSKADLIKAYLGDHREATAPEIAKALGIKLDGPKEEKAWGVAVSVARKALGIVARAGKGKGKGKGKAAPVRSEAAQLYMAGFLVEAMGGNTNGALYLLDFLEGGGTIADVRKAIEKYKGLSDTIGADKVRGVIDILSQGEEEQFGDLDEMRGYLDSKYKLI